MISEASLSDVSLKSFKVQKRLHPKFWGKDGHLNSQVRLRLLDIADDYFDSLDIDWVECEDIILTGSIANYNWSRYSDIDLHIIIDFAKVGVKHTDILESWFASKRDNWSEQHENLKIYGFPVEIYVEDIKSLKERGSGVYSLEKNQWLKDPDDFQNAEINNHEVKRRAVSFMNSIEEGERLAQRKGATTGDLERAHDRLMKTFDKMKKMRKESLKYGEMSTGNLVWKVLRRQGYIDRLWTAANLLYDRANSI